jgi:hypothetical protein
MSKGCLAELRSAEIGEPGCTAFWNSFSCWAMLVVMLLLAGRPPLAPADPLEGKLLDGTVWSTSRREYLRRRLRLLSDTGLVMRPKSGALSWAEVGI